MVDSYIGLLVAEGFEENPNLHKVQYTCDIVAKLTLTKVEGKFARYITYILASYLSNFFFHFHSLLSFHLFCTAIPLRINYLNNP
jgi:hypothetical protein